MTAKINDYWKDTRMNYNNVVLGHLQDQIGYMQDIASRNHDLLEEENPDSEECQYWGAMADTLRVTLDLICTGFESPKKIERARMRGIFDAFNSLIEGMKQGEFME